MFKEIRRKDRKMESDEAIELLKNNEYGVLSIATENGYAYGVPLNYVLLEGDIYFHCALEGFKLDSIKYNPKVSFCVIGKTQVISKEFTAKYESVIVFGKAIEVVGEEKEAALVEIVNKYSKDYLTEGIEYIKKFAKATKIIKISVESITGKCNR